jgi:hypothetical protein
MSLVVIEVIRFYESGAGSSGTPRHLTAADHKTQGSNRKN